MSSPSTSLERQTIVAPLGLRFRDAVTGAAIREGLQVTVYPSGNAARRTSAQVNRSGTYVLSFERGLREFAYGAGDSSYWNNLPPKKSYTIEVIDTERRFLPYSFKAGLPVRGLFTWRWPLGDASVNQAPAPAASFSDDFEDNVRDTALWKLGTLTQPAESWDQQVTALEKRQQLEITPLSNAGGRHYNGYLSVSNWNLTDARATVVLVQAATGAAQTMFTLSADGNNWFRFLLEDGKLSFQASVSGGLTSTQFATGRTLPRFWRLRHERSADQIFFETSADNLTWSVERSVSRQISLTAMTIELNAGTSAKVAAPGTAIFDNFALEANPAPAMPLFSAPTRIVPGGMAVLRATLWNASANAPASWARLEARSGGLPTVRGMADAAGRVALVFPYPEPAPTVEAQGKTQAVSPFTRQDWPINLFAWYTPSQTVPRLPDLASVMKQARANIWADLARTNQLTQVTLRAGQELLLRSYDATNGPLNQTPLSVLLITPAG
jgi:hypothetical protein